MLVLSRKQNEELLLFHAGQRIVIRVVDVGPNRVRIGIEAPEECVVVRGEIEGKPVTSTGHQTRRFVRRKEA